MGLEELLGKAFNIGISSKFFVEIGSEEIREMTYVELGTFLITNINNIETIKIKMRD